MFGLTVSARAGAAVIDFLFTVEAGVTQRAAAAVPPVRVVSASPTVEAWSVGASHCAQLTVFAVEARGAGARIAVLEILEGEGKRPVQNIYLKLLRNPKRGFQVL